MMIEELSCKISYFPRCSGLKTPMKIGCLQFSHFSLCVFLYGRVYFHNFHSRIQFASASFTEIFDVEYHFAYVLYFRRDI